jgi:hypothetical protein
LFSSLFIYSYLKQIPTPVPPVQFVQPQYHPHPHPHIHPPPHQPLIQQPNIYSPQQPNLYSPQQPIQDYHSRPGSSMAYQQVSMWPPPSQYPQSTPNRKHIHNLLSLC